MGKLIAMWLPWGKRSIESERVGEGKISLNKRIKQKSINPITIYYNSSQSCCQLLSYNLEMWRSWYHLLLHTQITQAGIKVKKTYVSYDNRKYRHKR